MSQDKNYSLRTIVSSLIDNRKVLILTLHSYIWIRHPIDPDRFAFHTYQICLYMYGILRSIEFIYRHTAAAPRLRSVADNNIHVLSGRKGQPKRLRLLAFYQFHQFCRREDEEKYALDRYNPARVYDVLDTFEKLGKPVQISEITIASYNGDSEDMDIQAELLKNMYKIWFSHKSIDGIVYWNLVDGYTYTGDNTNTGMLDMAKGENQFGGALLYNDMTPKPAFKTLKQLVNDEWHTSLSSATNDVGEARIRGFKGMYDVEFE